MDCIRQTPLRPRPEMKSAWREGRPSAGRSRGDQWKPAEQADHRKEMQNRLPHRNLVLEAERGRASRRPLLDAHAAMLVSCAPGDQLDQRFRLIGEAVGCDFDAAQQVVTLEDGAVVVAYIEPERPIQQGGEAFGG